MDNIYKNIEECNPNKKRKTLIIFDGMIADMLSNKTLNFNPIISKLFIRVKKQTFLLFLSVNLIRLNSAHYFIMKITNKQELKQITFNHLSDIHFKDFINLYKKYTAKSYNNPLSFRKNISEKI